MMKASSMDFANLYDFENEFQFQLYKDIRRRRVASTWKVTRPCDLNHMAGHVQPENTSRRSIATFTSPDCYASLPSAKGFGRTDRRQPIEFAILILFATRACSAPSRLLHF